MGKSIPIFAVRGNDPPRNSLFRMLREMWIEQGASKNERRKSKDLAVLLDVREQAVSQWASGSDRREPLGGLLIGYATNAIDILRCALAW